MLMEDARIGGYNIITSLQLGERDLSVTYHIKGHAIPVGWVFFCKKFPDIDAVSVRNGSYFTLPPLKKKSKILVL